MELLKKRCLNFFKESFRKATKTRRRKIVSISLLIGLLLFFYVGLSWFNVSDVEVALVELKNSFNSEIICHEKCALFRQAREQILVNKLKSKNQKTMKIVFNYWSSAEENRAFKKALVKILFLTYGANNPPPYLREYLNRPDSDLDLVREIIFRFPLLVNNNPEFKNNLVTRIAEAKLIDEKVELMKIVGEINNDLEIDSYFATLLTDESPLVKRELIKNISNIKDKSIYFTLNQLEIIKNLILNINTDSALRRDLVLLLGDYYLIFPEASAALWEEIYNKIELDSISRLFSADNLNHLASRNLALPVVSPAEWEEYYNN